MAETCGFFDAEELTDGTFDREYIAEQWANYFKLFVGNGVFATPTNQLKVIAYTGMFVKISIGWAFINGYWYHNDTELEVEIPANMTANTITDGIFIRWDSANREIKATVGVNRTTPNRVAPYYELKLADIVVATGATQITDAEITDTRMDSSVCGIVTGIIDVIDAGNLFTQYESIFTQWMNTTDTDFDSWRDDQEALYTQWYNAIKAQQTQDLADFDEWFDAIKGQLSTDAAGHLQNEIDDIIAQGLSGSIFTITTIQQELFGKDVTITGVNDTKTGKFNNQGVAIITGFTDVGTINISSTDNLEIASTTMNIPYFGRYSASIAFWAATVNLEGVESLYGSTITVKDSDNLTVGTVVLSAIDGTGVFTATAPDTYTFTTTYEGETLSWELEVSQETTYTLELSVGFAWQNWLVAGALDPTDYESLDEVLADEKALWKLFTKHSSVDYLANVSSVDSNVEKIINNDLCAKWINLRDYALDKLYANQSIAAIMDEADKYFYGEWALLPQVPKMTSNTAPYGEVTVYRSYGSENAYRMFDGNDSTWWEADVNGQITDGSVIYHFPSPIKLAQMLIRPYSTVNDAGQITKYTISGSNDGSNWTDIVSADNVSLAPNTNNIVKAESTVTYEYLKLTFNQRGEGTNFYPRISELQFYAWGPKGAVPIMTSDTAPYGTASVVKSGGETVLAAWKSFANDGSTGCLVQNALPARLIYKFTNPTCIKRFTTMYSSSTNCMTEYDIDVSNDGTNWTTLESVVNDGSTGIHTTDFPNNTQFYLYVSINATKRNPNQSVNLKFGQCQFYGRQLSVSVPVMSSNTAPYGEVSGSGSTNYYSYHAFSNSGYAWNSGSLSAIYDFGRPVVVKAFRIASWHYANNSYKIIGSNDGTTWVDVLSNIKTVIPSLGDSAVGHGNVENTTAYRYYGFEVGNSDSYLYPGCNFYGLDYSEREFEEGSTRKWLYDHGLELETFNTAHGTSGQEPVFESDKIVLQSGSASSNANSEIGCVIDLTNYKLARLKSEFFKAGSTSVLCAKNSAMTSTIAQSSLETAAAPNNFSLGITNIDGQASIGVNAVSGDNSKLFVNELWLEA